MPGGPLEDALKPYTDAGWGFLPLGHNTDEKWGKVAVSGYREVLTPAGALDHFRRDYNVGALVPEGHAVIDIDRRHLPDGVTMGNAVELVSKTLQSDTHIKQWPRVKTGDGGWHIYVRVADRSVRPDWPRYLEFLPGPRQIVAAGSVHPTTRHRYHWDLWEYSLPLKDAPTVAVVGAARRAKPAEDGERTLITAEELARLLSNLKPEEFRDYHGGWFNLLCAAHHATDGSEEGLRAFARWSGGDRAYAGQEEMVRVHWDSLAERTATPVTVWTLVYTVRKHGGEDIPERLRRTPDDEADRQYRQVVDELSRVNSEYALVVHGSRTRILVLETQEYMLVDEWKQLMRPRKVWLPTGPKGTLAARQTADVWMDSRMRREHTRVVLDPRLPPGGAGSEYNLWRGLPELKVADEVPAGFLTLVNKVLSGGDAEVAEYLWNWAALTVQRPEEPAEVAVVLRGGQGTGKGTFARALLAMVAPHSQHLSSPEQLVGRFTAGLQNCVLLYMDEAFSAGLKTGEGELKRLITEPTLRLEPKFRESLEVVNRLSVIMSSNKTFVVPVGLDDRRYMVTDVAAGKLGPDRAEASRFFARLNREMDDGGLGALREMLLKRDISGWDRRRIPMTAGLMLQKLHSLGPVQTWWVHVLATGVINGRAMDDRAGFSIEELMTACRAWNRDSRGAFKGKTGIILLFREAWLSCNPICLTPVKAGATMWRMAGLQQQKASFKELSGIDIDMILTDTPPAGTIPTGGPLPDSISLDGDK